MDPYKYVVTTYMRCTSNPVKTVKLIKNENVIASMIEKYTSLWLILNLCKKPCATNRVLHFMISFLSFCFHIKTHLNLTDFIS